MAYTAQFGNGFSATISAEAPRRTQIVNGDAGGGIFAGAVFPGAYGGNNGAGAYGGFQMPDVVANLRIDQAWGSAQIMGAVHQLNSAYYTNLGAGYVLNTSHPDNELGWAVGGGVKVNVPMLGQGDYFQMQVNYSQGALRYIFQTPNTVWGINDGWSAGWGVVSDAVYGGTLAAGNATNLELTTAWNVNAAYEHFWNPRWRTSLYGGYAAVSYGDVANSILCGFGPTGAPTAASLGCDNDWQTWWIGSRTQWNVTKDFYMGLDVLYSKIQSANLGLATPIGGGPAFANTVRGAGGAILPLEDVDNWSFRFRVHRDFYP
jgi:hypothetical protein